MSTQHRTEQTAAIVEALKRGEIHIVQRPQPHRMGTLAAQGVRTAIPKETKRQATNEQQWSLERRNLVESEDDPEEDLQVVAQAPSKASAGALLRWQRWRRGLRDGSIPAKTRLRSLESRQRQSDSTKARLAKIEYTPGMWDCMVFEDETAV